MAAIHRLWLALPLFIALVPAMTAARTIHVEPAAAPEDLYLVAASDRAVLADSLWVDSLLYKLTIPAGAYEFGECVRMVFTITNFGSELGRIDFPSSCHDWFGVYPGACSPDDPECESTWTPTMSCNFLWTSIELDPGETEEFVLDWRQHTSEGTRAPSGAYTCFATTYNDEFYDVTTVPASVTCVKRRPAST